VTDHLATVEWRCDGSFRDGRYSRAHRWRFDGGAVIPASASPGNVPAPWSDPAGVDPEEALVAAVSSCHMLWFLHLARDAGLDIAGYSDEARGTLGKGTDGKIAITRVVLRPRIDFAGEAPEADALARLHCEAHERCFIANSLKAEVVIEG
jgi:organic hydroperoxide reductase OsmC/OhrA